MKMKIIALNTCVLVAAALLAGCDNSKSKFESTASESAMPKTQDAVSTAADETKKAVVVAATKVTEAAKATASDVTSQFLSTLKTQGDSVLSSIGQDLGNKVKSLVDSCSGNESVKTNLDNSLTALMKGKDSEALAPAFQTAQGTSLTPSQTQLAKEVGNLASAFVVQRNFSSLNNAQGDVATLVNALRNGQYAATLPPLQKIMNNASLTPQQKDLLGSVADKYAPALKSAAGGLQQGLQKLQGLPGVKQ